MDYNADACLEMVCQAVKGTLQKPRIKDNKFVLSSILSRLSLAYHSSKLLEMYCDIVGMDLLSVRKKIAEVNLQFLYDMKYNTKKHIKLLEDGRKWTMQ